jgi:hypothetical protein
LKSLATMEKPTPEGGGAGRRLLGDDLFHR